MIHDQLLNQFTLLLKTVAPPLIRVTDTPGSASIDRQWQPGDRLPATVLTNLPNGRFQVQVDQQTLELNLPKNTQPGEQLELVYVGNSPRLTFTLASALPASALPPIATTVVPDAALTGASLAPADLSETAHMLGQLAQQGDAATGEIVAQPPVLASPPADTRQLAAALANALDGSGLFYESHQAQWVQGERPLASLLQEPQAQQGQAANVPVSEAAADGGASPAESLPVPTPLSSPHALLSDMDARVASLLQQQLQILNTGAIQWSGPVWPGQQMQWEISGLPDGQAIDAQQWQTKVNLTLPHLGTVSAWLLMGPNGLQVRLQADQQSTRQLLATSGMGLETALQTAGLNLAHYSVEPHG